MREHTRKAINELSFIEEINRVVTSELTLERLYEKIFNQVMKIVVPKNFRLDLLDGERTKAVPVFFVENGEENNHHPSVDITNSTIIKTVVQDKKIILTTEFNRLLKKRDKEIQKDMTVASFIGLPLVIRNRCIGLIMCWDEKRKNIFSKQIIKLLSLVADQSAVAIYNAQLFEQLNKSINDLTLLHQVEYLITSILDLDQLLDTTVNLIGQVIKNVHTVILIPDKKRECLVIKAMSNGVNVEPEYREIPFNRGIVSKAIKSKRAIYVPCIEKDVDYVPAIKGMKSELAIPLMVGTKILGVIDFESNIENYFDRMTIDLLDDIAHRISIALENALLYEKLEKNYEDTVRALVLAVETKDAYTRGHSERLTDFAVRLAKVMNLSEQIEKRIYWAGLLHDIGKIGISEKILNKPDILDDFEFTEIQRHPIEGVRMLQAIEQMAEIIPIIKHHHESFDGSGYPDKLKGNEIPLEARILAVCDVYDALTSGRPYRPPYPKAKTIKILMSLSGTKFDPSIVEKFIKMIKNDRN